MAYLMKKLGLDLESEDVLICPKCQQNDLTFDNVNVNAERISINIKCICCRTNRQMIIENKKGVVNMFWFLPE